MAKINNLEVRRVLGKAWRLAQQAGDQELAAEIQKNFN
jgi:hypothetical protein